MELSFRMAMESDLDSIDELIELCDMKKWNFKIDLRFCFIAYIPKETDSPFGRIVGVSAGRMSKADNKEGFAGIVAIHPDYRKMGIGPKLSRPKHETLKKHGARTIYADVTDPVVVEYLKRDLGYKETKRVKVQKGSEQIEMVKMVLRVSK